MSILQSIFSKILPSSLGSVVDKVKNKVESSPKEATTVQPVQLDLSAPDILKNVDVVSILDDLAKKNTQKLNWKTSIVDLLKLLGLDSSLDARKKLAAELSYQGNTDDSAAMNIWLHKEVMKKIAEKGGNVKELFN